MEPLEFWQRVDRRLDERRDPLDDEACREHLLDNPAELLRYAALAGALRSFAARRQARAARRLAALGVGALVLLGLLGWAVLAASREPEVALPGLARSGDVLRLRATRTIETAGGRFTHTVESGTLAIQERCVHREVQPRIATPHGHPICTERSVLRSRMRPEVIAE